MSKQKTVYFCTSCGNEFAKWYGQCSACKQWGTLVEHIERPKSSGKGNISSIGVSKNAQQLREISTDEEIRFSTGMGELDRVLGGGAVAGSLVLVSGAPGIGKSTLLLQTLSL